MKPENPGFWKAERQAHHKGGPERYYPYLE